MVEFKLDDESEKALSLAQEMLDVYDKQLLLDLYRRGVSVKQAERAIKEDKTRNILLSNITEVYRNAILHQVTYEGGTNCERKD